MVTTRANTYGAVGMLQRRKRRLPVGPRVGSKRKNAFPTRWREGRGVRRRFVPATVTSRRMTRGKRTLSREYAYKKSRLRKSRFSVTSIVPYVLDRIQGVKVENPNEDNSTFIPGFFPIDKPDLTTADQRLPVYVVCLSNYNNTGSTIGNQIYRANISDTGGITFSQVQGQDENGNTATSIWRNEKTYMIQDAALNAQTIQRDWLDVRLKLYGCRRQDVTYDIYLVTFKMEEFQVDGFTDPVMTNFPQRERFWQELARPCVTNTILPSGYNWKRGVRVLRSKRVILKAKESSDLETNPESVDLKWYIRGGKRVLYAENPDYFTSDTSAFSTGWKIQSATRTRDRPLYSSDRMYLIVRATDMETRTTVNGNDDPSFDMVIRRKSRLFGSIAQ